MTHAKTCARGPLKDLSFLSVSPHRLERWPPLIIERKLFWKKKHRKGGDENVCPTCGNAHLDLPALGYAEPSNFSDLSNDEKAQMAECDSDFCVIRHPDQTDRYIRACLHVPINNTCDELQYGIWVSLSETSFDSYNKIYKEDNAKLVYFGMVANEIGCYHESTIGIHVNVETRNGGSRPELKPHESEHPLVLDWKNGISNDEALRRIEQTKKNGG